jgi:hypothetical protein
MRAAADPTKNSNYTLTTSNSEINQLRANIEDVCAECANGGYSQSLKLVAVLGEKWTYVCVRRGKRSMAKRDQTLESISEEQGDEITDVAHSM